MVSDVIISYTISLFLTAYTIFFFYQYKKAKDSYKKGKTYERKLTKMTFFVLLPLAFIFGVLPQTDVNNFFNPIIGIIIIIFPLLL